MSSTLINVSNRLPVAIKNGEMTKSAGGLVAALEGLPKDDYDQKWIGFPSCFHSFAKAKTPTADRRRWLRGDSR